MPVYLNRLDKNSVSMAITMLDCPLRISSEKIGENFSPRKGGAGPSSRRTYEWVELKMGC